jgi:hypothetical protein
MFMIARSPRMLPFTFLFIRTSPWVVSYQRFFMVIADTNLEIYEAHAERDRTLTISSMVLQQECNSLNQPK